MRRTLFTQFIFSLLFTNVFAQQGEIKLPLGFNQILKNYSDQHPEPVVSPRKVGAMNKTGDETKLFPFVDRFIYPQTALLDSLWQGSNAKKSGRSVIMDAIDSNGNAFGGGSGNFGPCDILQSKYVNLGLSKGSLYFLFEYSTGQTWTPGDSLIFEFQTGSGAYRTLWTSPGININNARIVVPVPDISDYLSADFNFRFVNYSTQDAFSQEDFIIHAVVVADKWILPAYENFFAFDSINRFPLSEKWMQKQTKRVPGEETGKGFSSFVAFDSRDEYGNLYNSGVGSGYADTLMSQLIDIQQFKTTDSVYLRFYYRAKYAGANDSLVLEFRNNVNAWTRIWQTAAPLSGVYQTFVTQLNIGRNRHANFQFRLIGKNGYSDADSLRFFVGGIHIGKALFLPFVDDFSASRLYPDQNKWTTKHTYINNDFPVRPPSLNVATFDGLNAKGNPYGSGIGYCDTLASGDINLSSYAPKDSIYLSFWVEPTGLGEAPNTSDLLELEFRSSSTESDNNGFRKVWSGSVTDYPSINFSQVLIPVLDSSYFHDVFQFRFKNKGNLMGNLNQWQLDYIRLDNARNQNDSFYKDIAINSSPGSLLKEYYSMPYSHYVTNKSAFTQTDQLLSIKNNDNGPWPVQFERRVLDPEHNQLDSFSKTIGNFPRNFIDSQFINQPVILNTSVQTDSLIFTAFYRARIQNTSDNIPFNDTFSVSTVFSNYFAYDDGTAENGYAIQNTTGKVALAYELQHDDSLQGISIFFNRSHEDVSLKTFDLMVWSDINTNGNGTGEKLKTRVGSMSPVYYNKINGFYYYKFVEPVFMPRGKFYIGWQQSQVFQLNIGWDENYTINGKPATNPNLWYFLDSDGIWKETGLKGALMMRPIVGTWITPPVGIRETAEKKSLEVMVYPNPATGVVYFSVSDPDAVLHVQLFDIAGRLIADEPHVSRSLNLPSSAEGLYFLKITDESGNTTAKKVLIQK